MAIFKCASVVAKGIYPPNWGKYPVEDGGDGAFACRNAPYKILFPKKGNFASLEELLFSNAI